MKKLSGLLFCLLLAGALSAFPAMRGGTSDWSGTWLGKTVVGGNEDALTLVLKKDGKMYAGTIQDAAGIITAGTEITSVQVLPKNGLKFSFQTVEGVAIETTVTVDGESMKGEWIDSAHGEQGPVEMARKK